MNHARYRTIMCVNKQQHNFLLLVQLAVVSECVKRATAKIMRDSSLQVVNSECMTYITCLNNDKVVEISYKITFFFGFIGQFKNCLSENSNKI